MSIASVIEYIDKLLWGWPLIILLFGTHIFMTIRTGFIQKDVFKAIKLSFTKDPEAQGDVSQFGALATTLSSTIGTGNIIGVGTAIVLGGPGAVLFLSGMIAMETKRYSGKHLEDKDESDIPVVKNSSKGVLG